jgi:SET domain-containing protein
VDEMLAHTGGIYVASSRLSGRGVFAGRRFEAGDTIEVCPVLYVGEQGWEHLERAGLSGYYFAWNEGAAIALGYGSLYNHSWRPNAQYHADDDAGAIVYSALTTIEPGDEITVNYCGDPAAVGELWFDAGPPPV